MNRYGKRLICAVETFLVLVLGGLLFVQNVSGAESDPKRLGSTFSNLSPALATPIPGSVNAATPPAPTPPPIIIFEGGKGFCAPEKVSIAVVDRSKGLFKLTIDYGTAQVVSTISAGDAIGYVLALTSIGCKRVLKSAHSDASGGPAPVADSFPVGRFPVSPVFADFNGDGLPDLAVANEDSNSVSVLLRKNDGTYLPSLNIPVGTNPVSLVAGDFNGDGKMDLVVLIQGPGVQGSTGNLSLILGNGDGTFQAPTNFGTWNFPQSVAVADFNGDGKLDLVVVSNGTTPDGRTNNVSILLSNGNGTFQAPMNFNAGTFPRFVAAGDFNGDGKADLAVANSGSNDVSIFLGNGNGTFQPPVKYGVQAGPVALNIADVNGDGKLDLVVLNSGSNSVSILLGKGDGTFQAGMSYATGSFPTSMDVADLNGDGKPDIVVGNLGSDFISILLGNGDGTFQGAPVFSGMGDSKDLVLGDFNGDGILDVATANLFSSTVSILLGNGDGNFQMARTFDVKGSNGSFLGPSSIVVGDFNGDGKADLATANSFGSSGGVSILRGNGDGSFQPAVNVPTPPGSQSLAVGDFNADGKQDLVVANAGELGKPSDPGSLSVLLGKGDGTFQPAVNRNVGSHPSFVAVGDLNGDGKQDLVVVNNGTFNSSTDPGNVLVLLGNGDGTFQSPVTYSAGTNPRYVTVGDVNKDGKLDLVVSTTGPNFAFNLAVFLGNGDGTFKPASLIPTDFGPGPVAIVDIDGDGNPDLVITHCCGATLAGLMLGNGDGTFQTELEFNAVSPTSVKAADLNGDGKPDLVFANGSSNFGTVSVFLNALPGSCPNILITPGSLPSGSLGTAYSQTLNSSGGTGSVSFSVTSGVLPPGVTLSGSGALSGTPTAGGVFIFTVTATDANGCRKSQSYSLTIVGPVIGASTRNLSFGAGGANTATTVGSTGAVRVGYATLTVNGGKSSGEALGAAPYATAVFSLKQNGVVVSEAGVPASPPTTAARMFIDFRNNVAAKNEAVESGTISINTGVAVVNMGAATAHITYTLRNMTGTTLMVGHGTMGAKTHAARFIDQLKDLAADFTLPADFATATQFGTLEITSDQPLSVLALRLTVNQRGETLLTSTPVADLTAGSGTGGLNFPQITDGGGFTMTLVLLNTSGGTETGTLQLFDDSGAALSVHQVSGTTNSTFGYSIAAGGVFVFQTDGAPPSVRVGSVQVMPTGGTTTPVGEGIFRLVQGGVVVAESGVPAATPTTHARVYVDTTGGHNTGIAVAAPSGGAVAVVVSAFQSDGVTPAGTSVGPVALAGNGHAARFAGELVTGLPTGFTGVLDLTSSTPFAAVTLRSLNNERREFLFTTFPIADFTRPAPSPIVFPQIADGGGFQTQVLVLSAGGAAATTLSFFDDSGSPLTVGKANR